MKQTFWYTFATEVLAFSDPNMKFVIGIVKQDTAKKLQKSKSGFFLMPKDVTRHKPHIFKQSIQSLFTESKKLVNINTNVSIFNSNTLIHEIISYAQILEIYHINYSVKEDQKFIRLISPLCPWTFDHIKKYLNGKDEQVQKTVGFGSVIILEIHKLNSVFKIEYTQANRDSSQVKSIEDNNIPEMSFNNPILNSNELKKLMELVDFVYNHTR